jgi:hypothetical protein
VTPATIPFLTILCTAVATAFAAQVALLIKDHWIQNREGRFSSLYAALFFEQYAADCSYVLGEKDAFISSDGHAGTDGGSLPPLPDFPEEIDWQRVGIRLTEDAFAFRIARESAQTMINYLYNYDPPDGGDFEMQVETAAKGLAALDLACRIRAAAGLKAAHIPDPEYTPERYLRERSEHFNEQKRQVQLAQEASLRVMSEADKAGVV